MAQPGGDLGLTQRPLVSGVGAGLSGISRGDQDLLDRDLPVKQLVPAPPDDSHSAAADLAVKAVTAGDEEAGAHSLHGRTIYGAASEIPVSGVRIRLFRDA